MERKSISCVEQLCVNTRTTRGLKRRLDNDPPLKTKYSETISSDLRKGYVSILSSDELASTRDDLVWYVPHHPLLKPQKPDNVRRLCNAASKFRGYSLNDMLLAGPDLLAKLMGIRALYQDFEKTSLR